ncbi:methyltransferase domain-containing protein [Gryllotalpicola reticulitermitis]|uniref:Methyltransferase domain-containing protein n=1 Tax=Gryllotalpicola reticulitermitis TaxID=1184153 RepID=A0ABV8Q6P2_9MICO
MAWNPQQYELFEKQRARPFFDLLSRVDVEHPRRVVDLGCGTGALTATLAARWPEAEVIGLDSSPEMLDKASVQSGAHANLSFRLGDIAEWAPAPGDDVVVSNAALQWVPRHDELLSGWFAALEPGAQLAVQMPANSDSPSQVLLRELADEPRWADRLSGLKVVNELVGPIDDYLALAFSAGVAVEAWETVYEHVLQGEDPVLEWVAGTRLRPFVAALGDEAPGFVDEFRLRLRAAFPPGPAGTVFPFRRLFFVVTR